MSLEKSGTRWAIIGISIPIAVGLALTIGQSMEAEKSSLWVQLVVALFVIGLGAYVAISSGLALHSAGEKTVRDSDLQTLSVEDRLNEALLAANQYTYNSESDWWQRLNDSEGAPFSEIEVLIYSENGEWLLSGSVFVVLNECAWVSKSAKRFQYRNGSACNINTLLSHERYQQRLARSEHLIFVGMESYENSPQKAGDDCNHEWLSECRADEMAHRTRNSVPERWPLSIKFWELDIGASNINDPAQEFDQRRAIILGVRNRKSGVPIDFAIKMMAVRTPVNEVRLKDYPKLGTANPILIEWVDADGEAPLRHK